MMGRLQDRGTEISVLTIPIVVCKDMAWEPKGRQFKARSEQNTDCGLVIGEVQFTPHYWGVLEQGTEPSCSRYRNTVGFLALTPLVHVYRSFFCMCGFWAYVCNCKKHPSEDLNLPSAISKGILFLIWTLKYYHVTQPRSPMCCSNSLHSSVQSVRHTLQGFSPFQHRER